MRSLGKVPEVTPTKPGVALRDTVCRGSPLRCTKGYVSNRPGRKGLQGVRLGSSGKS